jgi:hypothetical protein
MTFSIITPSYGQLEWLRLCVASVADQVSTQDYGLRRENGGGITETNTERGDGLGSLNPQSLILNPPQSPLAIEHIIQDAGTPGIEEFAREVVEELRSRYGGDFFSDLQTFELLNFRTTSGYTLRIFKEPDAGMYDALNKGIAKMGGDLWAWLNSDEQYLPGPIAYVAGWFLRHPNVDMLCGDGLLTDREGNALSYRRIVVPSWHHARLVHLSSLSCASFYRRSIIEKEGVFDTSWRSIGDAEWMARMLKSGIRVKACGELLSAYAFTGQNTSASLLAAQEQERWELSHDAPPQWLRLPAVLIHRLRKMLAGAYRKRTVTYALYVKDSESRHVRKVESVGWEWKSGGMLERVANLKPKPMANQSP